MLTFTEAQTPDAFLRLSALAHDIWTAHYTPMIGSAQVAYMLEQFQSPAAIAEQVEGGTSYYLLRYREQDAGYLAFYPKADVLFLSKFYVGKAWLGQGLGRATFDFVCEQANTLGLQRIQLTVNKQNTDALRVYERLGFTTESAAVFDIGQGYVMDDFVLERAI
jgi:RimJ/RimL family protein N-acetyltransferase